MKLIIAPNKILRQRAKDVTFPISDEDKLTINTMIKHIDDSQSSKSKLRAGAGIAAPQLGVSKRMFYINVPENDLIPEFKEFLINPIIVAESQSWTALESGEGCLSVDENDTNTEGLVHRRFKIIMKGYSYFAKKDVTITKTGYHSVVLQHEYDHLNGVLFVDKIHKKNKWLKKDNETLL
ncbi:peptide deformylase [Candidatus Mycoplasma mahonii]|uniref:peptide deformylase n=1 Tax=Candidatus Mycoplasma mahonii TaxID=3004105 RepID=UPI0026EA282D|nr:peptide deformylase [Candidatus Mycoplasma mahonii]WKX02715.1 peptide deformylase [Candidatus Mycoplasma mahonii]